MDVLREREVKDSLERQLQDEQKVRGEYKSTRVYVVEIARGGVSFSKHRIETVGLLKFTSGTQSAPQKIDLTNKQCIERPRTRDPRHTVISRAYIERLEQVFEAEA